MPLGECLELGVENPFGQGGRWSCFQFAHLQQQTFPQVACSDACGLQRLYLVGEQVLEVCCRGVAVEVEFQVIDQRLHLLSQVSVILQAVHQVVAQIPVIVRQVLQGKLPFQVFAEGGVRGRQRGLGIVVIRRTVHVGVVGQGIVVGQHHDFGVVRHPLSGLLLRLRVGIVLVQRFLTVGGFGVGGFLGREFQFAVVLLESQILLELLVDSLFQVVKRRLDHRRHQILLGREPLLL